MAVHCLTYAAGCCLLMLMIAGQCAGTCDHATVREFIRHCSYRSRTKRSIQPEVDRSIMGRLRSTHNSNLCQPINPKEVADYEDGSELAVVSEDQIQKMIERLEQYRKGELLYGRHPSHAIVRRGGFHLCSLEALEAQCMNKKYNHHHIAAVLV